MFKKNMKTKITAFVLTLALVAMPFMMGAVATVENIDSRVDLDADFRDSHVHDDSCCDGCDHFHENEAQNVVEIMVGILDAPDEPLVSGEISLTDEQYEIFQSLEDSELSNNEKVIHALIETGAFEYTYEFYSEGMKTTNSSCSHPFNMRVKIIGAVSPSHPHHDVWVCYNVVNGWTCFMVFWDMATSNPQANCCIRPCPAPHNTTNFDEYTKNPNSHCFNIVARCNRSGCSFSMLLSQISHLRISVPPGGPHQFFVCTRSGCGLVVP